MQTEWVKNLLLAREVMQELPPEKVNLDSWQNGPLVYYEPECGTIACFGGWLALSPKFPQVEVGAYGRPKIVGVDGAGPTYGGFGTLYGAEVAEHLFGNGFLFSQSNPGDHCGDHRAIVLNRIEQQLKELGYAD